MPTLFLHAGAPKTGTSYLQVLFARYAHELNEAGILYPKGLMFEAAQAGRITSGNGVEMANYIRPHLPHAIEDKDAFYDAFVAQLAGAEGKDLLYSSEWLVLKGERAVAIADAAKAAGYDTKVIYFVRDISTAAYSVYSQEVKRNGETRTFFEFLKTWDPHYRASITHAVEAVGEENLIVLNYEEHAAHLAEVVFGTILKAGFVPEDTGVVNRSLSAKETELLRLMNMNAPKNPRFSTFVSDALMYIDGNRESFAVTGEEAAFLEKRFSVAVEFVNRFVNGRPTVICADTVETRPDVAVNDFERAMVAIVGKIASAVVK